MRTNDVTVQLVNPNTNELMRNYQPVSFTIQTINGTATAPDDFISFSSAASIPAGSQTFTQTVETINDAKTEYTETMTLGLVITSNNVSNPTSEVEGIGTIKDYDMPNLFSPNNDGKSDFFTIPSLVDFPNFSIEIFDRWGSKVFSYSNQGSSTLIWWDGTNEGQPVPGGVYFYILHYNDDKTESKTNFIQLIR